MTDRYKLADMLDIGAESLKKRLNCSKRFIAKRDLLIAICLLLYANETGINAAIRKYNKYMWRNSQQKWYPLFSRENRNERDKCIIESMNEVYRKYPIISRGIVDEINNRLISKKLGGFDLVNQYNKKGNDFICVVKEKEDNEDERWHQPGKVSEQKYHDDLLKQNSIVYDGWKKYHVATLPDLRYNEVGPSRPL